MNVQVRTARPTDDLATLWPGLGRMKLNLDQIWLAVDIEQRAQPILGGLMVIDGGHEVVYVGEFTIAATSHRRLIAKRLLNNVLISLAQRGRTGLIFHVEDPYFASLAMKRGARALGLRQYMAMGLNGERL